MTEDEELARRFRGQLDEELADVQVRAGARDRLRRQMREKQRTAGLRTSVMVPLAAAAAIVALLLAIPALLERDRRVEVVPAGPSPVSSQPEATTTPFQTAAPTPDTSPAPEETPSRRIVLPQPTMEDPEEVRTRGIRESDRPDGQAGASPTVSHGTRTPAPSDLPNHTVTAEPTADGR